MSQALLFVDAIGGGLATLGAAVARSLGHSDATAATTKPETSVPPEVSTVLEEVGMSNASVGPLEASKDADKRLVIWLGTEKPPASLAKARAFTIVSLFAGEGELERLSTARVARDRIERHLPEIIAAAER
ncbi:hypothetical protein [Polyangium aurulentum]|uniref:hypothetical protein n=1 Tax=Polyangium aurulentum TaxID=2567896 RepID=UPI0010AED5BF|nr:hypothetical protein [Polyangium aurulentum]UQA61302.1 hypothetical protein E8A73_012810 [Polyangium aurulentum]